MKIELQKFGKMLISRPAGREAALVVKSYFKPKTSKEPIELNFLGVDVLAPSWIDEFVSGLKEEFSNEIVFLPSSNASVIESLKMLENKS